MSIHHLQSQVKIEERFHIEDLLNTQLFSQTDEGKEIRFGLTQAQKTLPPRYFYDEKGSQIFEQICVLPEYYPTRTEAAILQQFASEIAKITGTCELVELGSGSSTKTRFLLDAYQQLGHSLYYHPIDVSASILELSAKKLLKDYQNLQILAWVSTYEQALKQLKTNSSLPRMLIFLGSTLGNFSQQECDQFFLQVTEALTSGDYFLLGVDLQKSLDVLEAAYNDSQGVTAAFNLNMLAHLNNRFQGNFKLNYFKHLAFYNENEHQIEMHLISQNKHKVSLEDLDLIVNFAKNETILTEISRKFNLQTLQDYLSLRGLKTLRTWTDPQQLFGLLLCQML